jgi:hypothetical protein
MGPARKVRRLAGILVDVDAKGHAVFRKDTQAAWADIHADAVTCYRLRGTTMDA